jgi:acetyl esterase/lipase
MIVPDAVIPMILRLRRANAPFMTSAGAREEVDQQALRPASSNPPAKIPRGVTISVERAGEVPVYTIAPTMAAPTAQLVYAHGGGWVHDISPEHWAFLFQLSIEARLTVTVPIYTLLPYGNAAQANALMLRLYDELAPRGQEVLLGGDSAGGQIALSAALGLRDRGVEHLRTLLVSPALDLTLSNPRIPAVLPEDPWLGVEGTRHLTELWRGDLPLTDTKVSPLNGEMRGLGPMVLCSGTRDILNPDAHLLRDKARAAGVDVTFLERDGAVHVFPLLPTPIGRAARSRIIAALGR